VTAAPVVLVPGLGLTGREWHGVRLLLDARTAVLRLPSMGLGALRGGDLTVEAHADRVAALLPARPVVLVGHSASCPVVVEVARRVQVAGLVLVGPVTDPRAATWPRMVGQWLRTARHERVGEVPVLAPQYTRTGVVSMLRGMDAVRRYRTDEALAGLDVPVEVVRGERDRIAPLDWCEALSPRVTTVPGGGHMVPLTHPDAVADAVRRVVARAQDAPRSS
jgi:pimeloyl-ACP methyl ester carboxylesterase